MDITNVQDKDNVTCCGSKMKGEGPQSDLL